MSRGALTGKSVAQMDAVAWLSNVKVGTKRGDSSGAGSAEPESTASSRLNSRSRPTSRVRGESEGERYRSPSRTRGGDDRRDENTQSLQDECVISTLFYVIYTDLNIQNNECTQQAVGVEDQTREGAPCLLDLKW